MITQTLTDSYKLGLLTGASGITSAVPIRIALYSSTATLNASTTLYSTTDELPTANGYSQGGLLLTLIPAAISNGVAYLSFQDVYWPSASFIAAGALIYRAANNAAVAVLNFGGNKQATGGNFTIQFPANTATSAIIRIT
jgi:hypothetical protein